jgi:hypothetical protein
VAALLSLSITTVGQAVGVGEGDGQQRADGRPTVDPVRQQG